MPPTSTPGPNTPATATQPNRTAREAREAAALRENLRRRKAHLNPRSSPHPSTSGDESERNPTNSNKDD